nr:response regulator [Bradyrhizobium sp. ARR65]
MEDTNLVAPASIFLLEDETLIRMMLAGMVEELGHRVVVEAANVHHGKILAETADFDLALLDINLAGHNVAPVAEIVAKRDLPFLFVTGYAPGALPKGFEERPSIEKPFVPAKLKQAIELALRDHRET